MREKISLVRSSDLLDAEALAQLKAKKNLLAFSAGVDSTALFFLLEEAGVGFDIAIVDYNTRLQSKEEVAYAKALAQEYHKHLYHDSIHLPSSNFEHTARQHRYQFFEHIMIEHHYHNLITAHQLNDRLEWFLMQLSKGAGLVEMLGFESIETREGYHIVRPLLDTDKATLEDYLQQNKKHYFIDESNHNSRYKRNQIRHEISQKFLEKYKRGILKSFHYLQKDKAQLFQHHVHYHDRDLFILKRSLWEMRSIDKVCKKLGYLLSSPQKEEIAKTPELVIADTIAISFTKEYIFIAPYAKVVMDKKFKERCRSLKIPAKIRPYLFYAQIDPNDLPHA